MNIQETKHMVQSIALTENQRKEVLGDLMDGECIAELLGNYAHENGQDEDRNPYHAKHQRRLHRKWTQGWNHSKDMMLSLQDIID